MSALRIAIASGKGGTGKTTVVTSLVVALQMAGKRVVFADCDVEEPNGHLFLRPQITSSRDVTLPVPEVDLAACTFCGRCAEVCRYSAIVVLPNQVLTFPKLCHSCGACTLACPENAIREIPRAIGVVESGQAEGLSFVQGRLNVGEAIAPPVTRAVQEGLPECDVVIVDAPPGTSCPVIESVKSADVVLLVTEPTPFGLNDLELAVQMVRTLGIPFGVAINRADGGDGQVVAYCEREGIPVVLELPNDRAVASAYARGEMAVRAKPVWESKFINLFNELYKLSRQKVSPVPAPLELEKVSASPPEVNPIRLGPSHPVQELVVISGKGGTGKTSVSASLFALAGQAAIADCDVDAADLHLVLNPEIRQQHAFSGGSTAIVLPERCTSCGICAEHCRFDAIGPAFDAPTYVVNPIACEGCGVCELVCTERAIEMPARINGKWFISETAYGPMVHARLGIAQENSGKLVSLVRKEAKAVAQRTKKSLLISDGSPGIGCPVIASISGASLVLVVTEPTLSGLHDLERVVALTRQFRVRAVVGINKADIHEPMARRLEDRAKELGLPVVGKIRYDDAVTRAQVQRIPVVLGPDSAAAQDIRAMWETLQPLLFEAS
ncbi:MAG: ferredoxin [Deltaproteobacteria bacterium ADurb.Bin207]|nr:MAG: ferredoxin [Deltaproteobacteria bacterium ADurb.Bin207]